MRMMFGIAIGLASIVGPDAPSALPQTPAPPGSHRAYQAILASSSPHGGVYTFRCEDGSTVVVDLAGKMVRTNTSVGPFRCEETIVDGVVGPVTTPESCNVPVMKDFTNSVIVRQIVTINRDVVRWDGTVVGELPFQAAAQSLQLGQDINLRTGEAHDMDGHTGYCRRLSP